MRGFPLVWLVIVFAILAIIFGGWAFAADVVWVGAKILFWIFLALFVLALLGSLFRPWGPPAP